MSGACSTYWVRRDIFAGCLLVVKTKGKRPLGKPVHGLYGNMKTYLREIRWEDLDQIYVAQDKDKLQALINVTMELPVSYKAVNFFIT